MVACNSARVAGFDARSHRLVRHLILPGRVLKDCKRSKLLPQRRNRAGSCPFLGRDTLHVSSTQAQTDRGTASVLFPSGCQAVTQDGPGSFTRSACVRPGIRSAGAAPTLSRFGWALGLLGGRCSALFPGNPQGQRNHNQRHDAHAHHDDVKLLRRGLRKPEHLMGHSLVAPGVTWRAGFRSR